MIAQMPTRYPQYRDDCPADFRSGCRFDHISSFLELSEAYGSKLKRAALMSRWAVWSECISDKFARKLS
jgi:hypothetical protein